MDQFLYKIGNSLALIGLWLFDLFCIHCRKDYYEEVLIRAYKCDIIPTEPKLLVWPVPIFVLGIIFMSVACFIAMNQFLYMIGNILVPIGLMLFESLNVRRRENYYKEICIRTRNYDNISPEPELQVWPIPIIVLGIVLMIIVCFMQILKECFV